MHVMSRMTRTPFSWKAPSREEHPGPPFVLQRWQSSRRGQARNTGDSPEDQVIHASLWTRWKEPEKQLSGLIGVAADGQQSCPAGTEVEVNLGEVGSIDVELGGHGIGEGDVLDT